MIPFFASLHRLGKALARSFKNPEFRALFALFVFLLVVGTLFYSRVEKWSILDSFYFSVVTLSTAGFGDLAPQTNLGKLFTTIYLLLGTGVFVSVVAILANSAADQLREARDQRSERQNHINEATEPALNEES